METKSCEKFTPPAHIWLKWNVLSRLFTTYWKKTGSYFVCFIVLVVCLIILLASMFSGHSKLYSISLTNVSVLEASQGSLSDINTHDIFLPCIYPMWGDSENRGGDLLFNTCLACGQAKPKCFPLTFVALHAPSAQMLMYSRRGRRHTCVYKDLCVQRLSHPESQLLSSTRK